MVAVGVLIGLSLGYLFRITNESPVSRTVESFYHKHPDMVFKEQEKWVFALPGKNLVKITENTNISKADFIIVLNATELKLNGLNLSGFEVLKNDTQIVSNNFYYIPASDKNPDWLVLLINVD